MPQTDARRAFQEADKVSDGIVSDGIAARSAIAVVARSAGQQHVDQQPGRLRSNIQKYAGQRVLMISFMAGAKNCAALVTQELGMQVEVQPSRKAALAALREREYAVLVVEECMVEADPQGADMLWQRAGLAVTVQINFALSGAARLVREVKAALARRDQEQALAMRAATSRIECELKSAVTGLLLHSQLALAEPALSPQLTAKLQQVVELAASLRERLRPTA